MLIKNATRIYAAPAVKGLSVKHPPWSNLMPKVEADRPYSHIRLHDAELGVPDRLLIRQSRHASYTIFVLHLFTNASIWVYIYMRSLGLTFFRSTLAPSPNHTVLVIQLVFDCKVNSDEKFQLMVKTWSWIRLALMVDILEMMTWPWWLDELSF